MRPTPVPPGSRVRLRSRDAHPPAGLPRNLAAATDTLLQRLADLQGALYAENERALLLVLQGRDASGKDATVKAVCGALNPMGTIVTSFGVPTTTDLAHDYLWRVHRAAPARRMVGVFNRSHYEDVLAVRVMRLVPRRVWDKRFRHINEFERLLTDSGTTVVKIFLHVSKHEQRRRLMARLTDPRKNWKFSEADLVGRAEWHDYTRAYRDMLSRCSTRWAPWYVIPADDRHARNYLVATVLVAALERMAPRMPLVKAKVLTRLKALTR